MYKLIIIKDTIKISNLINMQLQINMTNMGQAVSSKLDMTIKTTIMTTKTIKGTMMTKAIGSIRINIRVIGMQTTSGLIQVAVLRKIKIKTTDKIHI